MLEQPATPNSSISIGLGPPSAAAPSMTTLWPFSVVPTKQRPSIHCEVTCMTYSSPMGWGATKIPSASL